MSRRTPDWLLERIALGELPPALLQAARARLAGEEDGPARLAELQRSNEQILAALPPAAVAEQVARRSRLLDAAAAEAARLRRRALYRQLRWACPAVAAAACGLLLLLPFGPWDGPPPGPGATSSTARMAEPTRVKGLDPHLVVRRLRGQQVELLAAGALAGPADVLQLSYVAAGQRYGTVLSLDGRGSVTLHLPETGEMAAALTRSGEVPLPASYELDDAPAFERFFFVTAEKPFAVAPVLAAARSLASTPAEASRAPLALPPGLAQSSWLLRKHEAVNR